jgi:hypothetical protein
LKFTRAPYRHFNNTRKRVKQQKVEAIEPKEVQVLMPGYPPVQKQDSLPIWEQRVYSWVSIVAAVAALIVAIVSFNLQRNDRLQQAQLDKLSTAIDQLQNLNKQNTDAIKELKFLNQQNTDQNSRLIDLNERVVDLVNEARGQTQYLINSDAPQIEIFKVSPAELAPLPSDSEYVALGMITDGVLYKQSITFKNNGRRAALTKAVYTYFIEFTEFKVDSTNWEYPGQRYHYEVFAGGMAGATDSLLYNRKITPSDTLNYSMIIDSQPAWNVDQLLTSYEVVRIIYKDPIGRLREGKFYFKNNSKAAPDYNISLEVIRELDKLTRKPPNTTVGFIRPSG